MVLETSAIEERLAPYVRAIEDEMRRHRDPGSKIMNLAYDFVEGGGKRLRPTLALLVCESLKGDWKDSLPVAVSYELAHTASLTQDDIIDNSPTRHNLPTAHSVHGITTAVLPLRYDDFDIFTDLPSTLTSTSRRNNWRPCYSTWRNRPRRRPKGNSWKWSSRRVDSTVED